VRLKPATSTFVPFLVEHHYRSQTGTGRDASGFAIGFCGPLGASFHQVECCGGYCAGALALRVAVVGKGPLRQHAGEASASSVILWQPMRRFQANLMDKILPMQAARKFRGAGPPVHRALAPWGERRGHCDAVRHCSQQIAPWLTRLHSNARIAAPVFRTFFRKQPAHVVNRGHGSRLSKGIEV